MNAKALLNEMALDLGEVPDFMPPEKRRRIEQGTHPYAGFGAFPEQGGANQSYAEFLASDQYPRVMRKLAQYTHTPVAQLGQLLRQPMALQRMVGQAMQRAMATQAQHQQELEQAAVTIVLDLPEFAMAKQAVQDGELRVIARLVQNVETEDMRQEPDEPDEDYRQELEIAQVAQEMNLEKEKRRVINLMIQGASVDKGYAFHLISDRLNEIDPGLIDAFGFLMAFGDFMYWSVPDQMQQAAHGGGGGGQAMGRSRFRIGEDGVPEVEAQAVLFPILIHEVVKGLMEYLSHAEDEDPETRRRVQGEVDVLDNEPWDMKLGAPVWRQILRFIGDDNQHLMPLVYRQLVQLPPEQFNQRMRSILAGTPEARAWLADLVRDIQGDMEENLSSGSWVARLLG